MPGNDDAIRAIKLFTAAVADAVIEGKQIQEERQKGEADLGGGAESAAPTAESPQAV